VIIATSKEKEKENTPRVARVVLFKVKTRSLWDQRCCISPKLFKGFDKHIGLDKSNKYTA